MNEYQQRERQAAITKRIMSGRRLGDICRCDVCWNAIGATQHELFPRSLTRDGTEARDMCLSRYVISLVCMACHSAYQSDPAVNRELLELNRKLWGESVVNNHIREMRKMGIRTDFQGRVAHGE